jgi:hypothetical protein
MQSIKALHFCLVSSLKKAGYQMIAKTYTCSLLGVDAVLVEVEVDLASGLPQFSIVIGYLT